MIKLKELICQLSIDTYKEVESNLTKTKADKFLFVLKCYREGNEDDNEIINKLGLKANALYVLKSRLYERIQNQLSLDLNLGKKEIISQLEQIPHVCYNFSNEISIAFLLKLEKELLAHDMHSELLLLYSALKKIHYNTDKYYHYSQLHNKHIAFWLSLEKAEDTLSDFNLLLGQYDFTRSPELITKLNFLRLEISNHSALNASKHVTIIKNIIDIQLSLFCQINPEESDIEAMLLNSENLLSQLSESVGNKKWENAINFLAFEYYFKTDQINKANIFFEKVNNSIHNLLLHSNIALVGKFLVSKIKFLSSKKLESTLDPEAVNTLLYSENIYCKVQLGLYTAMCFYYKNEIKKAIHVLNELMNEFALRDFFHIRMEINLTLAFFHLKIGNSDLAESLIDSIYRKIKSDKLIQYDNALDLIKFFNSLLKMDSARTKTPKQKESLLLFFARNNTEFELIRHLQTELKNY